MFKTDSFSPLDLHLDENNPRFRISVNPTQADIRLYMMNNENILKLADKMVKMDRVLPGERIIICAQNGNRVVLEGNRRTCIYQMLLNRDLIPELYKSSFPAASPNFLTEISNIPVDIVDSREEAMPYLAARHLEGVEKWKPVAKWRISYEYHKQGKSIPEISEYLVLTPGVVRVNISSHKILLRGVNNPTWTEAEKNQLNFISIEPDRLVRTLKDGTQTLGLYFDKDYDLKSTYISDENLDEIIKILTYKAFIEADKSKQINTRSNFADVYPDVKHLIPERPASNSGSPGTGNPSGGQASDPSTGNDSTGTPPSGAGTGAGTGSGVGTGSGSGSVTGSTTGTGGTPKPKQPYFFDGIDPSHLSTGDTNAHGLLRIIKEIRDITDLRQVNRYIMCSAYLTRALIEQSLKYYSKTHNVQGQTKTIWDQIVAAKGNKLQLSDIVKQYNINGLNYIPDKPINNYFYSLFGNYTDTIDPLNWVVHKPDEYMINPDDLITLPSGLLAVINYLLA